MNASLLKEQDFITKGFCENLLIPNLTALFSLRSPSFNLQTGRKYLVTEEANARLLMNFTPLSGDFYEYIARLLNELDVQARLYPDNLHERWSGL